MVIESKRMISMLFSFIILFAIHSSLALSGTPCLNPYGSRGKCTLMKDCRHLNNRPQNIVNLENDQIYIRKSKCGQRNRKHYYCCPEIETNLIPDTSLCGDNTEDKLYGGTKTERNEFPWLALLEYTTKPNSGKHFNCGGILVSYRYVLTAAHCTKPLPPNWTLSGVRLGEHDLSTDRDCDRGGCSPPPLDVNVMSIHVHEKYNPNDKGFHNDIALLRLARIVRFSESIQPICLPVINNLISNQNLIGTKLWVAGWGLTENDTSSNVKLKLSVPVLENSVCDEKYPDISLTDKQICAGGLANQDSCQGDSGGPLMGVKFNDKKKGNYYLLGIVSFGAKPCGIQGIPGTYTRVDKYNDWIVNNIVH